MYFEKTVCVVLPTYREKDTIREVIEGFFNLGLVDQIIVVNNNAEQGTSDEISRTPAIEILEKNQGYGAAIKTGIKNADSDLIVVCEPDGTFVPEDLLKLLPFTDRCSIVLGSRTVGNYIWSEANMGYLLRMGNWSVAKIIEILFNGPSMSDVGCTFRVISRELASQTINRKFSNGGTYGLEQQIFALRNDYKLVQVPVNYRQRVGVSTYSSNWIKVFSLAFQMLWRILKYRINKKSL